MPSWLSKPSVVSRRGGAITPALLISRSSRLARRCARRSARTELEVGEIELRSVSSAPRDRGADRVGRPLALAVSRHGHDHVRAGAGELAGGDGPRPLLAPVTTAVRPRLVGDVGGRPVAGPSAAVRSRTESE